MSKIVRTARGVLVDFDAIIIKNQMAGAPMNVQVARRKDFIDSKEGKSRGQRKSNAPVDANRFVTGEATRAVGEPTQPVVAVPTIETKHAAKESKVVVEEGGPVDVKKG